MSCIGRWILYCWAPVKPGWFWHRWFNVTPLVWNLQWGLNVFTVKSNNYTDLLTEEFDCSVWTFELASVPLCQGLDSQPTEGCGPGTRVAQTLPHLLTSLSPSLPFSSTTSPVFFSVMCFSPTLIPPLPVIKWHPGASPSFIHPSPQPDMSTLLKKTQLTNLCWKALVSG